MSQYALAVAVAALPAVGFNMLQTDSYKAIL